MLQMIDGGIGRVSERIAGALGESIGAAKHAARRVENVADDLRYNTSRSIKRHPARTVLASVGTAFAVGMLLGRVTRRH